MICSRPSPLKSWDGVLWTTAIGSLTWRRTWQRSKKKKKIRRQRNWQQKTSSETIARSLLVQQNAKVGGMTTTINRLKRSLRTEAGVETMKLASRHLMMI